MPKLKNLRQERFCNLFVALGNASEAYRQAGYHSKSPDADASQLAVKGSICKRIAEIEAENARKSPMSREEALSLLAEIARSPCDEWTKQADRERAIEIMARMCGWNSAERVELSANSLSSYLLELRAKPIGDVQVLEVEPKANNGVNNGMKRLENMDETEGALISKHLCT